MSRFDLAEKKHKIEELTARTMEESFWSDPQHAQTLIQQLNGLKDVVESYEQLDHALAGMEETLTLLKDDFDTEILNYWKWNIMRWRSVLNNLN